MTYDIILNININIWLFRYIFIKNVFFSYLKIIKQVRQTNFYYFSLCSILFLVIWILKEEKSGIQCFDIVCINFSSKNYIKYK